MFKVFFNKQSKKYKSISRNDADIISYECNPDWEEQYSGTKKSCDAFIEEATEFELVD